MEVMILTLSITELFFYAAGTVFFFFAAFKTLKDLFDGK